MRGSGKTSFLAALWHLIEAGEISASFVASQLQPDREYLNRIRDNWLKFQQVGRTSLRSQETVSLQLRDTQKDSAVDLTLPDLSGELFRLQWVTRKATRPYADFTADASGVLLLIHPTVEKSQLIAVPGSVLGSEDNLGTADSKTQTAEGGSGITDTLNIREWGHDFSPTQVKLVELLQFVVFLRKSVTPLPIAVVISAWDLVRDPVLPISWLESHLPLLFQFLTANADSMPSQVYGISALGGDLVKDLDKLRQEVVPSRRIKVFVDKLEPTHDLTAPIRFALGLGEELSASNSR
jgi:hypothetical protein